MKKILVLALVFVAASQISLAQNRGDMSVGGTINFLSTTTSVSAKVAGQTEKNSTTAGTFGIGADFSYFVVDGLSIGASIGFSSVTNNNTIIIAPELRYYLPITDNFYYTPGVMAGLASISTDEESRNGFAFGVALAGFEYKISSRLSLSADILSLSYVSFSEAVSGVNMNLGILTASLAGSPEIGVKYYF